MIFIPKFVSKNYIDIQHNNDSVALTSTPLYQEFEKMPHICTFKRSHKVRDVPL